MKTRAAATKLGLAAGALAAVVAAAGCGSTAPAAARPAAEDLPGRTPSLATSLTTATGTWAAVVMGGSAASHNNFWQLFERPAGRSDWTLVTPPGVADNGGLVAAASGGRSLITAVRPSQDLTFTPLTETGDGGQAWSALNPLDAALAGYPDALAAAPSSGHLLALLTNGTAKLAAPGYTSWATLTSRRTLAATPAGQRCGLASLTAATFTGQGVPLLAGACGRPGAVGIFAARDGAWQAAGPALPGALARLPVTVLRLTRTQAGTAALLETGSGTATSLLAAWSADGARWALSPPVKLGGATLTSASFGPAGAAAIVLTGHRGQVITGPRAGWRSLPALPAGTAALAPGPASGFTALAVHGTRLDLWQLGAGAATWRAVQVINVPVQFGSSG